MREGLGPGEYEIQWQIRRRILDDPIRRHADERPVNLGRQCGANTLGI